MMESRISQTPRALENTAPVLAQPNVAGSTEGGDAQRQIPKAEEYFWAEWIADRELLRESWLHWIKSPEQQQRHALYAAGERSAAGADELATRLVKAPAVDGSTADDVSDRLFWVLRKSR